MPTFDLIIKNATLPDGRQNIDILCGDGHIIDLGTNIEVDAKQLINAEGYMVSFVAWNPKIKYVRHIIRGYFALG